MAATQHYRPGRFLYVSAGAVHYGGTDVETVLIGTFTGAWSADYA